MTRPSRAQLHSANSLNVTPRSTVLNQSSALDTDLSHEDAAPQSRSAASSSNSRSRFRVRGGFFSQAFDSETRSLASTHQALSSGGSSSATASNSSRSLDAPSRSTTSRSNAKIIVGTLFADRFNLRNNLHRLTVVSGNGNVDFRIGQRDLLDLSNTRFSSIRFNWATNASGGVAYNPGTGTRIFDAIDFRDGKRILFEGIDHIRFKDRVIDRTIVPNDPLFSQQWNLHMMGVHTAWRLTTGSDRVAIGIADSGLGANAFGGIHPDLRATTTNLYGDYQDDFFDNFFFASSGSQPNSHGTAVQGIIAAASNNRYGMSGINWNSRVINLDVLGGQYSDFSLENAAQTIINDASYLGQRLVINQKC